VGGKPDAVFGVGIVSKWPTIRPENRSKLAYSYFRSAKQATDRCTIPAYSKPMSKKSQRLMSTLLGHSHG
jgi:hypothetical protein